MRRSYRLTPVLRLRWKDSCLSFPIFLLGWKYAQSSPTTFKESSLETETLPVLTLILQLIQKHLHRCLSVKP